MIRDTIWQIFTILYRTATESPPQQQFPRRCETLRQPLRSAPSRPPTAGGVCRHHRRRPRVRLESVHGDPLALTAHQHLKGLHSCFGHLIWPGVRRREWRRCTAVPDVHPPRLLELPVGLLLRLPDRSGRDETRAWPHVFQKIGGWRLGSSTNSPGRIRGVPYNSSAEDMALSSLGVVLMPSNTQGR